MQTCVFQGGKTSNTLVEEESNTQACEENRNMRTDYKRNLKIIKELYIQSVTQFTKLIDQLCSSKAPLKNPIANSPSQAKRTKIFEATLQTLQQEPKRPSDTRREWLIMMMKKKK
jgi:hypothetical protein